MIEFRRRHCNRLGATLLVRAGVLALLVGGCASSRGAQAAPAPARTLEIRVTVPETTPAGATVYLAGDFNNWNPAAPEFRLVPQPPGLHTLTLPVPEPFAGPIAFKFTLGSWDSVETDSLDSDLPNRTLDVRAGGDTHYTGTVIAWRSPDIARRSTATPSVSVISEQFEMPELQRTRRVWIYLPPDYATSAKRYPVLYMHDGQNLFDALTSYAGEWGVDESLDSLHAKGDWGAIVVGIDNGQARRFDEYAPWRHPREGGGEGDPYVAFLVKTLKPYIDLHYRTRPERASTAVIGSSMGGVISLYAALKYPEIFGHAGVFSPALWVTPALYDFASRFDGRRPRPRLYFVSGALEGHRSGTFVRDQERMVETLVAAGFRSGVEVEARVHDDGTHSEWFWRREFPAAFRWMFAEQSR